MGLLQRLQALLFPEKCVLCGCLLAKQELDLCRKCRVEAPEHPVSNHKHPYIDSWTAVWYYEGNVRKSLLRYKFSGRRSYAGAYGRLLAMKLLREEQADADVLTWIPISQKRLKKRGFDQVELLAQSLGQELGMEPVRLLWKLRDNPPQSHISGQAQRRANVLGAYEVINAQLLQGKRVLLLDDIITTGATAQECARVLLTAGASQVHLAAVAAAGRTENKTGR